MKNTKQPLVAATVIAYRPAAYFAILFLFFIFFAACSASRTFDQGIKAYQNGNEHRAQNKVEPYLADSVLGPGAELILLDIKTKKAKTLDEIVAGNQQYTELTKKYEALSPESARTLRKHKVGKGKVASKQANLQKKAVRLVERSNRIGLLDTVIVRIPKWQKPVKPLWDSARARVVNRNIRTKDYDDATSIINRHEEAVYKANARYYWQLQDSIWEYFEDKYPLCQMDKFRKDHPTHNYAMDCWFNEARDVFCSGSLENAVNFQKRYPYSLFDIWMMNFTLDMMEGGLPGDLSPEAQRYVKQVRRYAVLYWRSNDCGGAYKEGSYEEFRELLPEMAPRVGAYLLLMDAASYMFRHNQAEQAQQMLQDMKPYFPDTSVCYIADFDFQVNKQPRIDSCLACLGNKVENLRYGPVPQWNSAQQEYSAVSWDEGREVFFAKKVNKRKIQVMHTVRERIGTWSAPTPDFTLSYNYQAIPMSVTADGRQMLLKVGKFLYISQRPQEEDPWGSPIRLPLKIKGLKRAVFVPDGSALIIEATIKKSTINRKAESDLYYSLLNEKGAFEKPISLGYPINSEERECNPYVCADGKTMYYASNGYDDYGRLDIFMVRRTGKSWSDWTAPRNMGCQLNSLMDDYGFTWVPEDGKQAVFTYINRCNNDLGIFQTDIPASMRPVPDIHLRGQIVNTKGKPIGRGHLEININDGQEIVRVPVSPAGRYHYKIPENTFRLKLYVDVMGYYTPRDTVYDIRKITPGTQLRDTFTLVSAAEMKKQFHIRFATFTEKGAQLTDPRVNREVELLSRFVRRMKAGALITSHTAGNKPGSEAYSQQCAQVIRQMMVEQYGLPADSLRVEGKGGKEPLCPGNTPADQACNARVSVKFVFPPPKKTPEDLPAPPKPLPNYATEKETVQEDNDDETEEVLLEEEEAEKVAPKRKNWFRKVWRKIIGKEKTE